MQHDLVSHAYVAGQSQRNARIGMKHRTVLNVDVFSDGDDVVVSPHDAVEPDARVVFQNDRADHDGIVGNEVIAAGFYFSLIQGVEHVNLHFVSSAMKILICRQRSSFSASALASSRLLADPRKV